MIGVCQCNRGGVACVFSLSAIEEVWPVPPPSAIEEVWPVFFFSQRSSGGVTCAFVSALEEAWPVFFSVQ